MAYTPVILTTRLYWQKEVRTSLFGENDTDILPNSFLQQSIILGAAERRIKTRVGNYASLTGDDKENLLDATVMMVCAIVVPKVADVFTNKEKVADIVQVERPTMTIEDRVAYFLSQAEQFIGAIDSNTTPIPTKTIVKVVSPDPPMFESID